MTGLPRLGRRRMAVLVTALAMSMPAFGMSVPQSINSAVDDTATTTVDTPVTIDVLANDRNSRGRTILRIIEAPSHGQVQVVNGKVRYVPGPGFSGSDSFRYFTMGWSLPVLGRIGEGQVAVEVGASFTLAGTVTDGPIANAVVTASLDGREFSTVADAAGNYTLDIVGSGTGMVMLGARGTGSQSAVNFISVLGQLDRLREEAGTDGVLDRTENNQVQVTHVSTAQAFLLQAANDGAPLTSDDQVQQLGDTLDVSDMLYMAAAIKLVVDEGFPLPEGADDVLEMISDATLFDTFVADAEADHPGALDAALEATIADPAVTPVATAADYVGEYTLVSEIGAPGTIRVGIGQGQRLELDADGTGRYLDGALNSDPSLTWTFADNEVVAVFNNPVSFTSYPYVTGYGQVREIVTTTRMAFTRLVDGGGRDVFGIRSTYDYSYPDNPELGSGTETGSGSRMAIADGAAGNPFLASEFPALRTLPVVRPGHINASGYSMFDFAADGSGVRDDGAEFTWSLDDGGRLQVDYASGDSSLFTRLARDGRKGDGVVAVHQHGSSWLAEWSISNVYDGTLVFSADKLARPWRSGFDISQASLDPNILALFLVLDPDGSSVMASRNNGDPATYLSYQSWKFNQATGAMESTIYYDDSGWVPECTPPENGCYVNVQRRWFPVAAQGNRIYVIEELAWDIDGDFDNDVQHQRGNFYEIEPVPFPID